MRFQSACKDLYQKEVEGGLSLILAAFKLILEVGGEEQAVPAPADDSGKVPKIGSLENAESAEVLKTYSKPRAGHAIKFEP